ncbi:5-oxoprolinase subunit PxpB [Flavihumibacter petaseus]|uniref:Histidine kinase inhibitor KipI n=1 Tax=Flavihumibacter petaseus NBRC 106054 TaxID=1220578 RepID=A0A0E9MXT0_9BACT|nr:5-oxoprolinase subunit PxpB [Flavihumibacter petaseus]GAO42241.1 histidine kinase inhibitor KipI [Flavihumibacter petaseus NBRC 106054]
MDYTIHLLSESACTVVWEGDMTIGQHRRLVGMANRIRQEKFSGFTDCVLAIQSITIYFDPWEVYRNSGRPPGDFVLQWLRIMLQEPQNNDFRPSAKEKLIPVCYEAPYSPDLHAVAVTTGLTEEAIIEQHAGNSYYVFMIGFTPGFPYMGFLPDGLRVPRKAQPELKVSPGAVGIAETQTGIYPMATPAGWHIIGRTPLKIFDPAAPGKGMFVPGDMVRFTPVNAATFAYLDQHENT